MKTWPALSDACFAEYRADQPQKFPGSLKAENGSLIAVTDYELMGVMARELLEMLS